MRICDRAFEAMCLAALALAAFALATWADSPALDLGKRVFLELSQPKCAVCHSLADAGAAGEVGPNLDSSKPDAERVKEVVTNGLGVMPANDALTPEQVDAVALYVSTVAGKTK